MKKLAIVLCALVIGACSGPDEKENNANSETNNANSETNNANSETNNANSETNNANSDTNNANSDTNNVNAQTNNVNSGTNNTSDPVVVIENADCFELENDPDEFALAIDGAFAADSQVWRRPLSETDSCPADGLTPADKALTPYVAFRFCNADTVDHLYDFEFTAQEGPAGEPPLDDAVLIIYEGEDLPTDHTQCLAYNDDIEGAIDAGDSEILGLNIPAGESVVVIGTTFTFDPTDGTGTGGYILVATVAD